MSKSGGYTQISTAFDPLHIEAFGWNSMMSVIGIFRQSKKATMRTARLRLVHVQHSYSKTCKHSSDDRSENKESASPFPNNCQNDTR